MMHRVEIRFVDLCTVDYLTSHEGLLLGVFVDKASTWADVKQDLLEQLDDQQDMPEEDWKEAKIAVERWFNEKCGANAREETPCAPELQYEFSAGDFGSGSEGMDGCAQMWFRVVIDRPAPRLVT